MSLSQYFVIPAIGRPADVTDQISSTDGVPVAANIRSVITAYGQRRDGASYTCNFATSLTFVDLGDGGFIKVWYDVAAEASPEDFYTSPVDEMGFEAAKTLVSAVIMQVYLP